MQQDVLRLDVAMHDAAAMGVVERTRHLGGNADRIRNRELLVPRQPVAEGLALDVGHDVEQQSGVVRREGVGSRHAGHAAVEQGQDVRVLEVGGGLDLGQEALGADDGGEFGAEDLDGDGAIVLEVVGQVDRGHAALAELALDAVAVGQ